MSDDMETYITKLKGTDIIDEEMFLFLNQYRRNRNSKARIELEERR
ncbi:hypothetical protein [Clostridium gasigenes]|nr:hypothetical protein [Clostridium gasigenes]MBU3105595.1 hypothetical protein [Clostridium gasigenes]